MSFNRENVVWQSKNGSWNLGFYRCEESFDYYDDEDDDYDPEWDVDYDYDRFEWVSTGHVSMKSARDSWTGANPGMEQIATYKNSPEACENFDKMAEDFLKNSTSFQPRYGSFW